MKKVTLYLPEELLDKAQAASGEGITGTIRKGLEIIAASDAYDTLRRYRGKYKSTLDLEALREDR